MRCVFFQEELEARRRERSQEQARESEARARADPQHRLRMKLAGKPLEDCAHAPNEEELLAEKGARKLPNPPIDMPDWIQDTRSE